MAYLLLGSLRDVARFCEKARLDEALNAAHSFRQGGFVLPTHVLQCLLQRCTKGRELEVGRRLHSLIAERGFDSLVWWGNKLIRLFEVCGSLQEANQAFRRISEPDSNAWQAIILANCRHGAGKQSIRLFQEMQLSRIQPDNHVYVAVLKACASTRSLADGRAIHAQIAEAGYEDHIFVGNTLVDMYAKCGSLEEARRVFDELPERDVVSWNALLAGLAQRGRGEEALSLFRRMQQEGMEPDLFTFSIVLKACASIGGLKDGRRVHMQLMNSGLVSNVVIGNTLVDMYAKCGSLGEAREVFDSLPQKDLFSWNAMVTGYAKSGSFEEAWRLFDQMPERNVVTWSAMIEEYAQSGHGQEALQLFEKMQQEGIRPNRVTFLGALKACSSIAALQQGQKIHTMLVKSGVELDAVLGNTLLSMYSKCGSLVEARAVFDSLPKSDLVTWTAIIAAYAHHGHGQDALLLFQQLQAAGMKPDHITFLCVLSACGHEGLLDEGCALFQSMFKKFGISPGMEHYACMVDLFCRAGYLDKAEDLIKNMPLQPDVVVWTSVLGACLTHGNMKLGRTAFDAIINLEPANAAAYVLMSNIYEASGNWEGRAEIRGKMQAAGVTKTPGRTWIEIDNQVHTFQVEDTDHPQRKEILAHLKLLGGATGCVNT